MDGRAPEEHHENNDSLPPASFFSYFTSPQGVSYVSEAGPAAELPHEEAFTDLDSEQLPLTFQVATTMEGDGEGEELPPETLPLNDNLHDIPLPTLPPDNSLHPLPMISRPHNPSLYHSGPHGPQTPMRIRSPYHRSHSLPVRGTVRLASPPLSSALLLPPNQTISRGQRGLKLSAKDVLGSSHRASKTRHAREKPRDPRKSTKKIVVPPLSLNPSMLLGAAGFDLLPAPRLRSVNFNATEMAGQAQLARQEVPRDPIAWQHNEVHSSLCRPAIVHPDRRVVERNGRGGPTSYALKKGVSREDHVPFCSSREEEEDDESRIQALRIVKGNSPLGNRPSPAVQRGGARYVHPSDPHLVESAEDEEEEGGTGQGPLCDGQGEEEGRPGTITASESNFRFPHTHTPAFGQEEQEEEDHPDCDYGPIKDDSCPPQYAPPTVLDRERARELEAVITSFFCALPPEGLGAPRGSQLEAVRQSQRRRYSDPMHTQGQRGRRRYEENRGEEYIDDSIMYPQRERERAREAPKRREPLSVSSKGIKGDHRSRAHSVPLIESCVRESPHPSASLPPRKDRERGTQRQTNSTKTKKSSHPKASKDSLPVSTLHPNKVHSPSPCSCRVALLGRQTANEVAFTDPQVEGDSKGDSVRCRSRQNAQQNRVSQTRQKGKAGKEAKTCGDAEHEDADRVWPETLESGTNEQAPLDGARTTGTKNVVKVASQKGETVLRQVKNKKGGAGGIVGGEGVEKEPIEGARLSQFLSVGSPNSGKMLQSGPSLPQLNSNITKQSNATTSIPLPLPLAGGALTVSLEAAEAMNWIPQATAPLPLLKQQSTSLPLNQWGGGPPSASLSPLSPSLSPTVPPSTAPDRRFSCPTSLHFHVSLGNTQPAEAVPVPGETGVSPFPSVQQTSGDNKSPEDPDSTLKNAHPILQKEEEENQKELKKLQSARVAQTKRSPRQAPLLPQTPPTLHPSGVLVEDDQKPPLSQTEQPMTMTPQYLEVPYSPAKGQERIIQCLPSPSSPKVLHLAPFPRAASPPVTLRMAPPSFHQRPATPTFLWGPSRYSPLPAHRPVSPFRPPHRPHPAPLVRQVYSPSLSPVPTIPQRLSTAHPSPSHPLTPVSRRFVSPPRPSPSPPSHPQVLFQRQAVSPIVQVHPQNLHRPLQSPPQRMRIIVSTPRVPAPVEPRTSAPVHVPLQPRAPTPPFRAPTPPVQPLRCVSPPVVPFRASCPRPLTRFPPPFYHLLSAHPQRVSSVSTPPPINTHGLPIVSVQCHRLSPQPTRFQYNLSSSPLHNASPTPAPAAAAVPLPKQPYNFQPISNTAAVQVPPSHPVQIPAFTAQPPTLSRAPLVLLSAEPQPTVVAELPVSPLVVNTPAQVPSPIPAGFQGAHVNPAPIVWHTTTHGAAGTGGFSPHRPAFPLPRNVISTSSSRRPASRLPWRRRGRTGEAELVRCPRVPSPLPQRKAPCQRAAEASRCWICC
uniref:Uncharacterized protein n=1 Tax=Chromera velia CCMP2878 TaxID=1169474 RepID=A0A0G4IBH2_9ALVE|eukprot:Cvel_12875.t1-p1 / transcript=Cvel_12875.t1 / gene=Cvel_12875 / organism=Chromera_velia_CCMP2878 / gene_product=hypothetical protein / transcript_product=hypothetical protein / location=Cvel_scaffold859:44533-48930(-) / protein_length=1466 / sequence_SO=supercontig / SO=protein_coding / is_pseudo=false